MRAGTVVAEGRPQDLFYERYDESWGIDVPWSVAAAKALASRGVRVPGTPLDPESLARALV